VIEAFRKIAAVEGTTTLFLFFVAMPLKYLAGEPWLVPPAGWVHGVAFVAYVVMMVMAFRTRGIGTLGWLRTFCAALVPFGTFINDPWLKSLRQGDGTHAYSTSNTS
jgi:integral membrane protein